MSNSTPEQSPTESLADRLPTPEEEAAAERGARNVDVEQVAEHYEEMTELGANVRGEGEIEPEPS